jgi:hypothetical protein
VILVPATGAELGMPRTGSNASELREISGKNLELDLDLDLDMDLDSREQTAGPQKGQLQLLALNRIEVRGDSHPCPHEKG